MIINTTKTVCDRCGEYIELDMPHGTEPFNKFKWSILSVNGGTLHLCEKCSEELLTFLKDKGALNISSLFRNKEVI